MNTRLLRLSFALLVALGAAAIGRAEPVAPTPAPSWKLKDVNGNVVSSEQFKGKVVVVDFWATWCGPCRVEIPGYVALQKKYADDLVVIGMSLDAQGPGVVKKFVEKNKV
ncbi:MAG TPA: TlpA disulfide reductase family protein, partial [Opitutus sp.]|nr:TlpA disulfide reductase family protein [Opitutus sp.]